MEHKELVIVGGPNGAGKTTFANEFLVQEAGAHHYLGADKIAYELNPEAPEKVSVAAGREFSRQLRERITAGENLIVESTLSGMSLLKTIELARACGFYIAIQFVFLDTADLCIARVQERVRKGGHNVPTPDINRRFGRSISNFWEKYRPLADKWKLAYNDIGRFEIVALGNPEATTILNAPRFSHFRRLVELTKNA